VNRNGSLDKEFADVKKSSRMTGGIRHRKLNVSDDKASVFGDLGGADLDVEIGMLFSEFGENVSMHFVADSGIDDKAPHCYSNDDEQCSPAESDSE